MTNEPIVQKGVILEGASPRLRKEFTLKVWEFARQHSILVNAIYIGNSSLASIADRHRLPEDDFKGDTEIDIPMACPGQMPHLYDMFTLYVKNAQLPVRRAPDGVTTKGLIVAIFRPILS